MNLLERFFRLTKHEYFADFFITPPLTFMLACFSIYYNFGVFWIPLFLSGWFVWTFYEYATHRWLLHKVSYWEDVHQLHHDNQKDYIAMPPWATLIGYCFFLFVFGIHSSAFAIGFSFGYICYSALHTIFHYKRIQHGKPLYGLNFRHVLHHKFEDFNFGVTVSWWDKLLNTEV